MDFVIPPLRQTSVEGVLYSRRKHVEEAIKKSMELTFSELIEAGGILNHHDKNFIPGEVLIFRLRLTRDNNSDDQFIKLHELVMARVRKACPKAWHNISGNHLGGEAARNAEISERVCQKVEDLLLKDKIAYYNKLDYWEVSFNGAIAKLRSTEKRTSRRRENPKTTIEYQDGSGEVKGDVEAALASMQRSSFTKEENLSYRIQVRAAIDQLPDKERKVINMLLAEIPMNSSDPKKTSITKLLGCTPKTVRNRRDSAIVKLQAKLGLGGEND